MITKERIAQEFDSFIEYPNNDNKTYVTTVSTMLFAKHIADIAVAEERERCAKICEAMEGHPIELDRYDYANAIREGANHAE